MSMNHKLKSYYERTTKRFWDPLEGPVGRDNVVLPLVPARGKVLEYGFGSASLLYALARLPEVKQAVGADISEAAVAAGQQRLAQAAAAGEAWPDRVRLLQPVDDALPMFADGYFDTIVSVATIEHVVDPYAVLDEFWRLAQPGATLVCSVPNYAYIKHRIHLLTGRLPRTGTDEPVETWREAGWDGMHLHTFTQDAFAILLRDCGWEPVRWTGWGERLSLLRPLRTRFPGMWSGEIIAVCRKRQSADR
jgi:SAM-dependent methyltransferase